MANDIDKTSPHYKGEFGSIYEVNQKFPSGGVEGDYVAIDGWAHYWNADRGTWCVNAQRDSYWDELITNIIEHFKTIKGATYMGVATTDTVPDTTAAKMFYFALQGGKYANFENQDVAQGINVLLTEDGKSWTVQSLISVAQELGASTTMLVSQKAITDAINRKANTTDVDEALSKKADKETMNTELAKKFDKVSVVQETGTATDKVMSQKVVTDNLLALSSIKGEFLVYPKYVLESDPTRINPQADSTLSVLYFKPQKKKYITNIKSNNLLRGVMYLYKGTMSNFSYVKSITFERKDNLVIDLSNETSDFDFVLINYKDENKKWEDHFRYAQCGSVQDEELSEELLSKIDKIEKWKDFTIYPYFVLESDPSRVLVTTDGILHVFYFNPKKGKYMTNILKKSIWRGVAYLYKGSFENKVYVKSIKFEVKDNPIIDLSNETSNFDFVLINYKDGNKKWEDSYKYAQYQEEELSKRTSNNQWYGKKICIIGTSVAHGSNAETAYGYIAQQRLGFNTIPAGVPGQAIHGKIVSYTESGTDKKILSPLIYGSGTLTKAEYAAAKAVKDAGLSTDVIGMDISNSPNNPSDWAGEDKPYNNYYRTWENLFTEDNKDVALWIYATIPNNNNYSLDDWNNFDTSKWAYKDGTAFEDHRTTFLGAMLYLMDKMYSVQPTARMVLVIDSEFNYELGKNNFKLLSETYNIPIIDLWSKINISPKSLLQLKSFNGTNSHPSTFGHEIMGNIFTNELLLIS